jgi:hypothetical protein
MTVEEIEKNIFIEIIITVKVINFVSGIISCHYSAEDKI